MASTTFPEATADMTEEEARDMIRKMKAAFQELDKSAQEKMERVRAFHGTYQSRRTQLTDFVTVAEADQDKLANVITFIENASDHQWDLIQKFLEAIQSIREVKANRKMETSTALNTIQNHLNQINEADPDETVLGLRNADNINEYSVMAEWMKILGAGQKKRQDLIGTGGPDGEA